MKTLIFDNLIDPVTGENISVEIEEDETYLMYLDKVKDKASRSGKLLAAGFALCDKVENNITTMFDNIEKRRIS
ncbi:MAG: hypothetical protein DRQ35_02935 [Gammaproteobacteria bacterium]|nr:MAG: hypothetical protein DRQ35_02935 [Gammaproteobacteria bacterium]